MALKVRYFVAISLKLQTVCGQCKERSLVFVVILSKKSHEKNKPTLLVKCVRSL